MRGCIRCGAAMEPTYKFCMSCGYPAQLPLQQTAVKNSSKSNPNTSQFVCKSCGKELKRTDKFCGKCGHPVQLQTKQTASNSGASTQVSVPNAATLVCKGCGGKLDVKDRFCIVCGYPVQLQSQQSRKKTQTVNISSQQIEERDRCLVELNRIWNYFSKAQSVYNQYDYYLNIGNKLKDEYRERQKEDEDASNFRVGLIVVGSFVFCASFLVWGTFDSLLAAIILFLIGPALGFFGVYLVMRHDKSDREFLKRIKDNDNKLGEMALKLTKYYADYGYCIVDPEYTNPKILEKIIQIMNFERAYTLRDAIITFYHDCHAQEFMAKDWLKRVMGLLDSHGAKSASAFYTASFFLD